ncbi:MAG: lipopolysaccharide assembly protein LapA domain-containing protein, partial [Geminicoccaceae bacterium]|nr:lipopolysaccharide assembly protein LapA domain-containing protein [Geminicoccaceae bacterium]
MFKLIRTLLGIAGVVVITMFALANRGPVDVDLLILPQPVPLPLYSLFLAGLFLGAVLGGIASWLAGWRTRREGRLARRRLEELQAREQARLDAEAA